MADEQTYREAITEAVKDICLSITGIKKAEVDRSLAVNIDTAPMASSFVYAGPETRVTADNEATLGFETWDFTVIVEIWARKNDIENLLAKLHQAINDNRFLTVVKYVTTSNPSGRLLSGTGIKRDGADPQYFEVAEEKKAMIVPFVCRYRHTIGNMFVPQT
jgi:hypothetical protein